MKNLLTVLLLVIFVGSVQGQDKDRKRYRPSTDSDFYINLGLNNYLMDYEFPDVTDEQFTVRPWGSWYVALGRSYHTHLLPFFYFDWGGDVSWMNFKFEDENTMVIKDNGRIEFISQPGTDITNQKSKLTVAHLNAHFVPVIHIGRRHSGLRIGAGVYGGYRISTYTKNTYEYEGNKINNREQGNYFVNNLRYGVKGRLGFKNMDLFVNYDVNPLFIEGRGPELNPVTVGLIIQ